MLLAETKCAVCYCLRLRCFFFILLDKRKKEFDLKTKDLVLMALLVVLEVIATGVLKINITFVRITFTFVPMAIAGVLFGVRKGALIAALADLISFVLFPQGNYFLGYTISAAITGGLYGLLKGKSGKTLFIWIVMISTFIAIVINVFLNTIWLQMLLGKSWMTLIEIRLIKNSVILPIEIVITSVVLGGLKPLLERNASQ